MIPKRRPSRPEHNLETQTPTGAAAQFTQIHLACYTKPVKRTVQLVPRAG
jgi:hypothetical protein